MRNVITAAAVAGLGLTVLAGCGSAGASAAPASSGSAHPSASSSASAHAGKKGDKAKKKVRYLAKNTLHGTITVHTKKGNRTVEVQRGQVTAVSSGKLTVKSSDGYQLVWTVPGTTKIRNGKDKATASALKSGESVGVTGTRSGSTNTAAAIRVAKG